MIMVQPNQSYFNGDIPTYGGNPNMNMNIGGMGYNQPYLQPANPYMGNMGSYYNNLYSNYYDPYAAIRQEQEARRQQELMMRNEQQIDFYMTKISQTVKLGRQVSDEEVKEIQKSNPQSPDADKEEVTLINQLSQFQYSMQQPPNISPQSLNYERNTIMYNLSKLMPDQDKTYTLYEWFDEMDNRLYKSYEEEARKQQKNLSGMYNANDFDALLNLHNNSFTGFNSPMINGIQADLSDQVITLPTNYLRDQEARKRKFIELCMSSGRG